MPPIRKFSELSFAPITACTCADFKNHVLYRCPDEFCDEIHDCCENDQLVHKSMFIETVRDAAD